MTQHTSSRQTCAYEHCDAIVPEWSAFCSRACERAAFMSGTEGPVSEDGAMLSSLPPPRRHKAPRGSLRREAATNGKPLPAMDA